MPFRRERHDATRGRSCAGTDDDCELPGDRNGRSWGRSDDLNLYSFDRHEHRSEQSVSADNSEHVNAADDKFYLVALNHSGVNNGYTLRFEWSRKHYSGSTDGTTSDGAHAGPIVVLKEPMHTTWTVVYGQGSADDPTNTILPSGTGSFEDGLGESPVRTTHHAVGPPHTTSNGHVPLELAIGGVTAMLIYGAGRVVRRTRARSHSLHHL